MTRRPQRALLAALAALCSGALAFPQAARPALPDTPLRASDKSQSAEFGTSVALRGDVALIGAPQIGVAGDGAAYVFRYDGSSWTEEQKLLAPDAQGGDAFGSAVALGSDTVAVIGAPLEDETASDAGAAYVFRYDGNSWSFEQKLLAGDGALLDEFGDAVAMDGDTIAIGAPGDNHTSLSNPGSVYVFGFNGSAWLESSKLTAPDAAANDELGVAVATDSGIAAAGAWLDDDGGSGSGSAYVFAAPIEKPVAPDAAAFDSFGFDVALRGDTLLVGAPGDDDVASVSGSAYVFRDGGSGFAFEQKLTASDAGGGEEFGHSVALGDDLAVVGARLDDAPGVNSGSAYVYRRASGSWSEAHKLLASDAAGGDEYGYDVAVDGNRVLIGARLADSPTNAGSAYVVELPRAFPVPALSRAGRALLALLLPSLALLRRRFALG